MNNPWEEIPLDDYENHMKLDSVMQLQGMNRLMRDQLCACPAASIMVLGVAGGNGLEHIPKSGVKRVYGVDLNSAYLQETARRYPDLRGVLECLHLDLTEEADQLPQADLVIANLLIEYIGYDCFQTIVQQVKPGYVSCIIQLNADAEDNWVSDSPYLHVFDGLERVHHPMEERALEESMTQIGYRMVKTADCGLPNGKKLVQMDFQRQGVPPRQ